MAQDDELFHELHDNPKVGGSNRPEWDDKTVCELEKLLTEHLSAHFKHAIKSIVARGYKEQDAKTMILRSRLFHGNGDILSSIITSALTPVDIEKEPHVTGYHVFENLESLVKYTLLEMICTLREVKPSLTVLEAMWLLFIWDFNISNACTKELTDLSTPRNSESISYPIPKSTSKGTFKAKFLPLKSCSKSSKSSGSVNPTSSASPSYYTGIPYDSTLKKHIPQDGKDEAILELGLCLEKLQRSLEGWTDWANKKVKQGMIRVQEVKVDMITVKKVTEEVEKTCTDYLTTEHVELEKASARAVARVDSIDSKLSRLETEKPTLSVEMKSAQLKALECSRDLEKALQKEQIALKKSESIDLERRMLQQELSSLKRNEANLLRKVENAKVCLKQFEGQWRKENTEKLKSVSEAEAFRGRRERLETSGKAKENAIRERSRCEIQNIKKLEAEISLLKSETPQRRTRDEKRERECVVCWVEERSVLFLPCAHQVVCTQCNMKHEKEMDKCPSCRTLIRRRIQVRFHTLD